MIKKFFKWFRKKLDINIYSNLNVVLFDPIDNLYKYVDYLEERIQNLEEYK